MNNYRDFILKSLKEDRWKYKRSRFFSPDHGQISLSYTPETKVIYIYANSDILCRGTCSFFDFELKKALKEMMIKTFEYKKEEELEVFRRGLEGKLDRNPVICKPPKRKSLT